MSLQKIMKAAGYVLFEFHVDGKTAILYYVQCILKSFETAIEFFSL